MNYNIHHAMVARLYRKQQLTVERAVEQYERRRVFCANGGDPADFVPAPELPRCITDPLYNPK